MEFIFSKSQLETFNFIKFRNKLNFLEFYQDL